MASEPAFVLPGDRVDPALVPAHPKKPLRLGPGLRHVPPDGILPTLGGLLVADRHKNAIRVEAATGRVRILQPGALLPSRGSAAEPCADALMQYVPRVGELVVGTVAKSAADYFYVLLSDHSAPVLLPHMSFEGATRKTRPNLVPGALVYARVSLAHKHLDAELECVSPATGKADGLGPLTGGMLFDVSPAMARRLMMPNAAADAKLVVLDELARLGLQFETATGRNGKFWVDSGDVKTVLAVGRAVQETDDKRLPVEDQKKLVRKLMKDLS